MTRSVSGAAIILVAIMLAPSAAQAAGAWSSYGAWEPSSALDDPHFMYFTPPGGLDASGNRSAPGDGGIYFNGWQQTSAGVGLGNPNLAATGGSVEPFFFQPRAILGVWADCNGDNYVGLAETAAEEYRSALLDAQGLARCPDGTAHNHAQWVTELLWIAPNPPTTGGTQTNLEANPRLIVDDAVTVWADEGVPMRDHTLGGSTCWANPPAGSMHTVGGALDWIDCTDGYLVAKTLTGNQQNNPWERGAIPVVPTGGDENADQSALAYDCGSKTPAWGSSGGNALNGGQAAADDAAGGQVVGSPTGEHTKGEGSTENDFTTDGPHQNGAPGVNPSGSLAGTTNATVEYAAGDCDTSDDAGNDFYGALAECKRCQNSVGAERNQAFYSFQFVGAKRGSPSANAIVTGLWPNPDMPSNAGLARGRDAWLSDATISPPRDSARMARMDVGETTRHFITFFASVSQADGATPGGTDVYGLWPGAACDHIGAGAGIQNHWECDPTKWYVNDDGTPQQLTHSVGRPGQHYSLRDVDCWDQQVVGGVPVYAGPEQVGATCSDPYS